VAEAVSSLLDLARKHEEKLRYLGVSAWNYVFGNVVYIAGVTVFGKGSYLWMLVPANILGITNNFLGFKFLVFRTRGNYLREYLRMYVVYWPMILAQAFALPVLVRWLHLDPRIANPLWGVIAFVAAYFLHRVFTFKSTEEKVEELEAEDATAEGGAE
jgi:putative flippase GtrA